MVQLVDALRYKRKFAVSIPDGGHYSRNMVLGSTPTLNRNEYQAYLLEGKGDRRVRLKTLPPSCSNYYIYKFCKAQQTSSGLYTDRIVNDN